MHDSENTTCPHQPPFNENTMWLCRNLKTGYQTRIQGTLAEILLDYPEWYALRPLIRKGTLS